MQIQFSSQLLTSYSCHEAKLETELLTPTFVLQEIIFSKRSQSLLSRIPFFVMRIIAILSQVKLQKHVRLKGRMKRSCSLWSCVVLSILSASHSMGVLAPQQGTFSSKNSAFTKCIQLGWILCLLHWRIPFDEMTSVENKYYLGAIFTTD